MSLSLKHPPKRACVVVWTASLKCQRPCTRYGGLASLFVQTLFVPRRSAPWFNGGSMQKTFLLAVGLMFGASVFAQNVYDRSSGYRGRADDKGNMYDRSGRYEGRSDDQGNMYDRNGRYRGRIDTEGNIYDRNGRYRGRIDTQAKTDNQGTTQGKTKVQDTSAPAPPSAPVVAPGKAKGKRPGKRE
jgi:hypothetical protein